MRVCPEASFTVIDVAPSTTWAFVTIWPSFVTKKPEPVAWLAEPPDGSNGEAEPDARVVAVMWTTLGAACS